MISYKIVISIAEEQKGKENRKERGREGLREGGRKGKNAEQLKLSYAGVYNHKGKLLMISAKK